MPESSVVIPPEPSDGPWAQTAGLHTATTLFGQAAQTVPLPAAPHAVVIAEYGAGDARNGATVDTDTCETSGPGFASLCSVWQDPDFQPQQSAFYYARVVQNPSCRWATYQCNAAQVDCSVPDNVPAEYADCCNASYPKTVQERAWTSPIWYRASAPAP